MRACALRFFAGAGQQPAVGSKVREPLFGDDLQLDVAVLPGESRQSRHQPLAGKRWCRSDSRMGAVWLQCKRLFLVHCQGAPHRRVKTPARLGKRKTTRLSDKYATDNVRMNNSLPGLMDSLSEKAELRARIPMERCGQRHKIVATIAFLAGFGSGYITGQNLRVDRGITRAV